jgi:D-alanyl-D-alanine carboxypeptidase
MQTQRAAAADILLWSLVATAAPADSIDDCVNARMQAFHLAAVSMAIVEDGKVTKSAAYGMSDPARGAAATPDTVFKIASVSKQFITTAIMVLAQDGHEW